MDKTDPELLAALLHAYPETRMQLTVCAVHHDDTVIFVVAMRSESDPDGVVIGKGLSREAALMDAETCLQRALDSVDVAILKTP